MNTRQTYLTKLVLAFFLSFIWVLTLIIPASAANTGIQNRDEPYRIEEFSISTPGELEVRTSGGHVTVKGSQSSTVRVEMYVRQNGRDLSTSDTELDHFEITIDQSGDKVRAIARRNGSNRWFNRNNISISFVVYTPREMTTHLRTSGGHIQATGLEGDQEISTSGGHLKLYNLKGIVEARTSGGHIDIRDFQGNIEARTSGGHIETENASGTIALRTSGGHIDLRDINGTLDASTSGGNITANLNSIDRYVKLRTSGGHIRVSVPEGMGLDLNLRGNNVQSRLSNFSGEVERDEIRGTINGGGPELAARTSGGRVEIRYH